MIKIFRQFEKLQQDQKSMIVLCDIETMKTAVLESLTIIEYNFFPVDKEEDLKNILPNVEIKHKVNDDNIETRTNR